MCGTQLSTGTTLPFTGIFKGCDNVSVFISACICCQVALGHNSAGGGGVAELSKGETVL
jgi:hypothetical protein